MKLSKKLLLLVSIMLALCSNAFAFDKVTIDKIVYELIPKNTSFPNEDGSETKILADLARIVESKRPADSPDFATFRIPSEIDIDGKIYPVGWINDRAFNGCAIEKLIIPGNIVTIGERAFTSCKSLKEVVFEGGRNGLTISEWAFGGPIEKVYLDRTIYDYYDGYALQLNPDKDMANALFGTKVKQLEIGSNVTFIPACCFLNCKSLTSVTIPGNVKSLAMDAFKGTNLQELILEAGDTPLDSDYAFSDCIIERLTLNRSIAQYSHPFKTSNVNHVEIGQDITRIFSGLFSNCTNLESIKIPGNVKSIGVSAFEYCTNLSEVIFEEGLTEIEKYAFRGCSNLQAINLPAGVTEIGNMAFSDCTNLKSIYLPVGLTKIGDRTFSDCTNLKSVTIPEGVTALDGTFMGCNELKRVKLPSSLLTIGSKTFYACHNLEPFDLPTNLSTIGDNAFKNCQKFTTISIPPSVRSIGKGAFALTPLTSMYIEDAPTNITLDQIFAVDFYEEQLPPKLDWFHLGRNVVFNGSEDGPNMFSQCHLKNFTMSAEVTVIPEYFFSGWTEDTWPGLASFKLPEGVTELRRKCFENCTGLKELILPPAVKKIGINAFIDSSLQKLMVMSPEPPECSPYAFDDDQYANVELLVPTESFELYRTTTPWSKFAKIRGSEFTSIDNVQATGETATEWYDLKGMKVSGENMPAGIYLRRQGAKVEKIVIR